MPGTFRKGLSKSVTGIMWLLPEGTAAIIWEDCLLQRGEKKSRERPYGTRGEAPLAAFLGFVVDTGAIHPREYEVSREKSISRRKKEDKGVKGRAIRVRVRIGCASRFFWEGSLRESGGVGGGERKSEQGGGGGGCVQI